MTRYIIRRLVLFLPTLVLISILTFVLIELPPGDWLTTMVTQLRIQGEEVQESEIAALSKRYGLDQPVYVQYLKWIGDIVLHGDFGRSFQWNRPVSELIWERLLLTFLISLFTILFIWAFSIPIGVYSATHQYSTLDYVFTFLGFIGRAIPDFLIALILMWVAYTTFDTSIGGLFSKDFRDAPWSVARVVDMLKHIWVPLVVLGTGGTAGMIRTLRANLLDELSKPYVVAARAKGLSEARLVWKYPVRMAINPFISGIGGVLPALISGSAIVSVVLSLPTTGPLMLRALQNQDMYLAGSFLLMLTVLSITGTLISDILLAILDPRIRQTA